MSGPNTGDDEATLDPSRSIRFKPEALQRCSFLSRREREVLAVLATGATTDAAADRLRISRDEVKAHIQSSRHTLQARSKLEAVLMALAADVIPEPPA